MQVSYKRTYKESFLIIESAIEPIEYERRMLKENAIRCLLSFYTMQLDGQIQYWYDISGKQSLQDYLEQERISMQSLEHVFSYLLQAFEELNHYLIPPNRILMLPETIFVQRQGKFEIFLCFCPEAEAANASGLTPLMEYVVQKVDSTKETLVKLCFELYEMTLQDGGNLRQLHEMVLEAMQQEMPEVTIPPQIAQRQEIEMLTEEPVSAEKAYALYDIENKFENSGNYEEDEEEEDSVFHRLMQALFQKIFTPKKRKEEESYERKGEDFYVEPTPEVIAQTELLYQGGRACKGDLIYQGFEQEANYTINKDCFLIGHQDDGNDACLKSTRVSRRHAKIYKEGNHYYIEDLNSTNGTLLNGDLLNCKQRYELSHMDHIQFADVPYLFV